MKTTRKARKSAKKPAKRGDNYQHPECIRVACPYPASCRKDARGCIHLESDKNPKD